MFLVTVDEYWFVWRFRGDRAPWTEVTMKKSYGSACMYDVIVTQGMNALGAG